jgi:hypothetical protein
VQGFPAKPRLFKNPWKKKDTLSGGMRSLTSEPSGTFWRASAILRRCALAVDREEDLLSVPYAHAAGRRALTSACSAKNIPAIKSVNWPKDIPHCCQRERVSRRLELRNGLKNRRSGHRKEWYILIFAVIRMRSPGTKGSLSQRKRFFVRNIKRVNPGHSKVCR